MCVHPTKSGGQCKKNPELFLCGTHLLKPQFTVVAGNITHPVHGTVDEILIGETPALYLADGQIIAMPAPVVVPVERKPHGHVFCGVCKVTHPTVNHVKACYMRKYQNEAAEKTG